MYMVKAHKQHVQCHDKNISHSCSHIMHHVYNVTCTYTCTCTQLYLANGTATGHIFNLPLQLCDVTSTLTQESSLLWHLYRVLRVELRYLVSQNIHLQCRIGEVMEDEVISTASLREAMSVHMYTSFLQSWLMVRWAARSCLVFSSSAAVSTWDNRSSDSSWWRSAAWPKVNF